MSWIQRYATLIFALFALLLTSLSAFAGYETAFVLERSTNANQVVYSADLEEGRRPTMRVYWRMLAEDGHEEELTAIERSSAYGISILEKREAGIEFEFRALAGYAVKVSRDSGAVRAVLKLRAATVILKRIFLEMGGGLLPAPKSISIEGSDVKSGKSLRAVLHPLGGGRWREEFFPQ